MEKAATLLRPPTVQFLGAARTVTGSMHLVNAAGLKILLDCGLYLGRRPEYRLRNRQFPFDPAQIDAVVLTHAHIDHCGNLPNLVRQGFRGPIFCTPATRDLLGVMLFDSARINASASKNGDVQKTVTQCVAISYNQDCALGEAVQFRLVDAGHVLGSAIISLRVAGAVRDFTITYTGDLGRRGLPFLRPPQPVPPCDLLISECTYGGKRHPPRERMIGEMAEMIQRAAAQGGKVLIPAFSLGRTQIVTHYLHNWMHAGKVPAVPIYVDSPLVEDIMEVYGRHPERLTEKSRQLLKAGAASETNSGIRYVRSWEESRALAAVKSPCVIVASGGMLDGGRAVHHLQQCVDDPRCCIVLVSYQSPYSLGARLLERGPTVSFAGRTWNKWAAVSRIRGFSGHADHADFLEAYAPLAGKVNEVQLVHGESNRAEALAADLRQIGFGKVAIPTRDRLVAVR